jgi:hypothetical protein
MKHRGPERGQRNTNSGPRPVRAAALKHTGIQIQLERWRWASSPPGNYREIPAAQRGSRKSARYSHSLALVPSLPADTERVAGSARFSAARSTYSNPRPLPSLGAATGPALCHAGLALFLFPAISKFAAQERQKERPAQSHRLSGEQCGVLQRGISSCNQLTRGRSRSRAKPNARLCGAPHDCADQQNSVWFARSCGHTTRRQNLPRLSAVQSERLNMSFQASGRRQGLQCLPLCQRSSRNIVRQCAQKNFGSS